MDTVYSFNVTFADLADLPSALDENALREKFRRCFTPNRINSMNTNLTADC